MRSRARAHAELAAAARDVPARDDRRVRAPRRPARGPDGQFRGRSPQHRRGPRRLPGLHADRRRDRDRRVRANRRAERRARTRGRAGRRRVHVLGLLSPGGVHSHERQIAAIVDLAAAGGVARLAGARVPRRPRHAAAERRGIARVHGTACARSTRADARIASICGRYYAMDRDKRWERVAPAYALIVDGVARIHGRTAAEALAAAYARGESDEFVKPTAIRDERGASGAHARRRRRRVHELPRRPRAAR